MSLQYHLTYPIEGLTSIFTISPVFIFVLNVIIFPLFTIYPQELIEMISGSLKATFSMFWQTFEVQIPIINPLFFIYLTFILKKYLPVPKGIDEQILR